MDELPENVPCLNCQANPRHVCALANCPFRALTPEQYREILFVFGRFMYGRLLARVLLVNRDYTQRCLQLEAHAQFRNREGGLAEAYRRQRRINRHLRDITFASLYLHNATPQQSVNIYKGMWGLAEDLPLNHTSRYVVALQICRALVDNGQFGVAVGFAAQIINQGQLVQLSDRSVWILGQIELLIHPPEN